MTTVNHFVNDCHNLKAVPSFLLHRYCVEVRVQFSHLGLIISTLEIALANIHRNVLVPLGCGGCPSMQQSGLSLSFVFYVPSLWPPCIPFFIVACSSGINIALNGRSFISASRFPEACFSERQISRVFWTIRHSRFLEVRWTEQHSEFILLSSQVVTWESLVLPGFLSLLEEFCLTDTLCRETRQHVLSFTFKENSVKSFLEIFSSERIRA